MMGQRTHLFYKPPRGAQMREYMEGLYYALLEGRFLFDFVHARQNLLFRELARGLPDQAVLVGDVFRGKNLFGRAVLDQEAPTFDERLSRCCGQLSPLSPLWLAVAVAEKSSCMSF